MTRSKRHKAGNIGTIIADELFLSGNGRLRYINGSCCGPERMEVDGLVVCSLAILLYLNTLPANFAYDDNRAVVRNPDVLGETSVWQLFQDDFWGMAMSYNGSHKSYRPLCVLTFRLNHMLAGLNPFGYHLVNVILHAIVTTLFWQLAYIVTQRRGTALLSALLFASHPIHTEAVAGVVGRADLLAAVFFLLSLFAYHKYVTMRDKHSPEDGGSGRLLLVVLVGILAGLGMLCKEHCFTVLIVCVVYDLIVHRKVSLKSGISQCLNMRVLEGPICLTALGVALLWLRFALMGNSPPEFAPADNPAAVSESRLTRFLTFSYLPAFNIWLLLCPSQLSFDWSMDAIPLIETISDFRNFFTLVFYLFLVTAAWTMSNNLWLEPGVIVSAVSGEVVRANGHAASNGHASLNSASLSHKTCIENIRIRTVTFAFALLVLPFVPATNLFFYVGFVVAERILYISSFGYCLLISEAVCFLWHGYCAQKSHRRAYLKFAVAMLLILLSARTFRRNFDWLTEEKLYRSGSGTNPAKALGNLANILKAQGKFQEAEAYRQALNHRGNMADVHYNLGVLLQDQKRYSEAVESYKSAIQFRARMTMAYLNLGIVYTALGMKAEAEKIYIQCAFIDYSGFKDPRSHEQTQISALYNLGRLYADQGKYKEAVEAYSLAVERRPPYYPPQSLYNMLGEAYMKLNLLDKAEHWYRESLNVKSDHMPAHLTMGKLCHAKGQLKMAEEWFVKALQLVPDDTSALSHFGQFLAETGRHNEAAEQYLKASVLTPDDFDIIFNTANALREAKRNIEAEQFYRRSAALKPNDATAHMNLGAILHLNGKLAEAERSYLTSLKLKPNDLTTTENLKKLRAIKGNEQLKLRV